MSLPPGTLLDGRFEILRALGAGGLAEVYAARDRVTGEEVALKLLHDHLAREEQVAERFRRELSITRSLEHPGIVKVYELYSHDGRPFFTMQLLRGETLSARLLRGPVEPAEARRIAAQVCAALQAAHRKGVVHRDLKPQNIWLCADGSVKVLDFGLARVAGWARLTAQSTVMGTPGYLAPELLAGASADARADLYGLGAVLHELLTGQRAFAGSDPYTVLRKQREGPPKGADPVVARALDPDPERRFLDAGQLLRELQGQAAAPPPQALPALTGGDCDVVLHYGWFQGGELKRAMNALGVKFGWGRRTRLALGGKAVLAEGVSRASAEEVAALCREHGLAASISPARRPFLAGRRFGAWLHRFRVWLVLLPAAGIPAAVLISSYLRSVAFWRGAALGRHWDQEKLDALLRAEVFWTLAYGVPAMATLGLFIAAVSAAVLLLLGAALEPPPIRDVPQGDPALRRLLDGIARRLTSLRAAVRKSKPASRMALEDLLRSANALAAHAEVLGREAQEEARSAESPTLPRGFSARRDASVARLLEMAAALDEALAAGAAPALDSGTLRRLRDEAGFAHAALPAADAPITPVPPPVAVR